MTAEAIKSIMTAIAPVIASHVRESCQPLADRIADLEQRLAAIDGQTRASAAKRKTKP